MGLATAKTFFLVMIGILLIVGATNAAEKPDAEKTREELLAELKALKAEKANNQPTKNNGEGSVTQPADDKKAEPHWDDDDNETLTVIGTKENVRFLGGSGYYVDTEDIRQQNYDDVNRALRKVPGVIARDEDGYGLFPNISLRGVDTSRSAKVTIMEDGILMAPAPYSAPSAYYSPTTGNKAGLEVLKGSSQIQYGPHTTGGVINYLSTPIPDEFTAYLKTTFGMNYEMRVHGYVGDTIDTEAATIGYLIEGYGRKTDGYKEIDTTPDFRDGENTGFSMYEPVVKLRVAPKWSIPNTFDFKFSYKDIDADETYLGLSEADLDNDPDRRYAATRFDNIGTEHLSSFFKHRIEPTEDLSFNTTFYYNNFHRNWHKLHDIRSTPGGGSMNLSRALAGDRNGEGLAVLRGEARGSFRTRNNNRNYYSWGIDEQVNYKFEVGEIKNELKMGVRYHKDAIRRFQWNEDYTQDAQGTITNRTEGAKGDAGNRRQETDALAVHLKDDITFGKFTVTPGIRFEHLWHYYKDYNPDVEDRAQMNLWGYGASFRYEATDEITVFGGVHAGFSPPGPRAHIRSDLEEETSLGEELGVRYQHESGFLNVEVVAFNTDFENLIVIDNIGGTGTGNTENAGKARTTGVEFYLEADPGQAFDWGFKNPWHASFTYTNAELTSNAMNLDAEGLFGGAEKGNEIPYIPNYALSFGTGFIFEDVFDYFDEVGLNFTAFYVGETYSSANNTSDQLDPNANARFGMTEDYITVDASLYFQFNEHVRLFGGAQNLFNERAIVSRHPHGPRPNKPLWAYVGLELKW